MKDKKYQSWLDIVQERVTQSDCSECRKAYGDILKFVKLDENPTRVQEIIYDSIIFDNSQSVTYREIMLFVHQLIDTSPITVPENVSESTVEFIKWLDLQDQEFVDGLRTIEDALKIYRLGKGLLSKFSVDLFNGPVQYERTLRVTIGYIPGA